MFTEEAIVANENAIAEFLAKMILKYGDDNEAAAEEEEESGEMHKHSM